MKISYNWLKRYIDLNLSPEELANTLPMLGHEVDSVEHVGVPPLENVVVGEILKKDQHPDADRLTVCEVDVNDGEVKTIVCGATNHNAGDRVIVALPGAVLPGNFKIKKSKLRGVPSAGMLCSAGELGLPSESKGIIILKDRPELGTPVNAVFEEGDVVFDVELTANRGDCLSHIGIARELAAKLGLDVKWPEVKANASIKEAPQAGSLLKALSVETEQCPYYTAWMIRGVKIGPSPEWMQKHLQAIGLRPINNVVDITNWVMHECGQPLHAFDAQKMNESTIVVRQAKEQENITTLDEKKRVLDPSMMVIADASKPMVVAGVMGSLDAEVDDTTTDIILEAAYFTPSAIRKTARKLILATDSSHRFARDVDPENVQWAARRATDIILEIAGGTLEDAAVCVGTHPRGERTIDISPDYIRSICGFDVDNSIIENIFKGLGLTIESSKESTSWKVTVPSFRSEVERPVDLVEEFLRIHGTDKIPQARVSIAAPQMREDDPITLFIRNSSRILAAQQFNECCHYSLVDGALIEHMYDKATEEALILDNPLTSEMSHLRPSLIPGLLQGLKHNLGHGNTVRKFFETGRVFLPSKKGIHEWVSVAFVLLKEDAQRSWKPGEVYDFFTAKAIAEGLLERCIKKTFNNTENWKSEQPNKLWQESHAAVLNLEGQQGPLLHVGLLDIKYTKELGIDAPVLAGELLLRPEGFYQKKSKIRFKPFSAYPSASKDLALEVTKSTPAEAVRQDLLQAAQKATKGAFEVSDVRIFDVYDKLPDNKKSLAFELTFRSDERTLKEKEIQQTFEDTQKHITESGKYLIRT